MFNSLEVYTKAPIKNLKVCLYTMQPKVAITLLNKILVIHSDVQLGLCSAKVEPKSGLVQKQGLRHSSSPKKM